MLVLNFILPFLIIALLYLATLVISGIVLVRGAIILPIDKERIELEKDSKHKKAIAAVGLCILLLPFFTLFVNGKLFPIAFCLTVFPGLTLLSGARQSSMSFGISSGLLLLASAILIFVSHDGIAIFIFLLLIPLQSPRLISEVIKTDRARQAKA